MELNQDEENFENCILEMSETQDPVGVKFLLKSQDGTKTYDSHALILATRSSILADIFHNSQGRISTVKINASIKEFEILLKYLYTDSISSSSPQELIEVSRIARKLKISGTKRSCKYILEKIPINISNIHEMLKASQYFKMEDLRSECLKYILETPEFQNASSETVSRIASSKKMLTISSEILAARWLQRRFRSPLSRFVIPLLSCDEFLDLVEIFPTFFTFEEVACILGNAIRPGVLKLPSWCDSGTSPYSDDHDELFQSSIQVKTKCSKCFPNFMLCGEHGFEASTFFEIKVSSRFPEESNLRMLELAFGSTFAPTKNIEINLFRIETPSGGKTKIPFDLKSTRDNYYLSLHRKMRIHTNLPIVFCLHLRAFGLKSWEGVGPVSDCVYRVAQVPGEIFYNMRLKALGRESVCMTFLSDWLVFIDPKHQKKRLLVTSLFYSK